MAINFNKIAIKIPNGLEIYQNFPPQGPYKYTKIGTFGMQLNHLARGGVNCTIWHSLANM
jgi:hypothetical protein